MYKKGEKYLQVSTKVHKLIEEWKKSKFIQGIITKSNKLKEKEFKAI